MHRLTLLRGNALPPLVVKANPVTACNLNLKPFDKLQICCDSVVVCCVTLDKKTPEGALEVHDWVPLCPVQNLWHLFCM